MENSNQEDQNPKKSTPTKQNITYSKKIIEKTKNISPNINYNEDREEPPVDQSHSFKQAEQIIEFDRYGQDQDKEDSRYENQLKEGLIEQNQDNQIIKEQINFDVKEEINKNPGKIIHKSTKETYDEEGNRVVTTKIIREIERKIDPIKITNLKKEIYEKEQKKISKTKRKTYSTKEIIKNTKSQTYLIPNKIKNEKEINKSPFNYRFLNDEQSPIYCCRESDDIQNSMFSNEMMVHNSSDGTNMNNDYQQKFIYTKQKPNRRINMNPKNLTYAAVNDDYIRDFKNNTYNYENYEFREKRDVPSPIGYIATYSSGSENEEIGGSVENYKISENDYNAKYKKEGKLIKKKEITYEMSKNNYRKKSLNQTSINIHRKYSNSPLQDFQSPDRSVGGRFKKVSLAMISSLGPTCEDRKITRKMRTEVGGVVDLRQDISPVNNYKIVKFYKNKNNLNKEVNPKTKIEAARIIQCWWRGLMEEEEIITKITIKKITKIQSIIRGYLIRKKVFRIIFNYQYYQEFCEKIEDIIYRRYLLNFFEYLRFRAYPNEQNDDYKICKPIKYQILLQGKKSTKFEKIDISEKIKEELYKKYIYEKIKKVKSEHANEIYIEKEKKKPYIIEEIQKYEIKNINQKKLATPVLIDQGTQNTKVDNVISGQKSLSIPKQKKLILPGTKTEITYIQKSRSPNIPHLNNQINKENNIHILYQKPCTVDVGEGGTKLGIDTIENQQSINYIIKKKLMVNSQTDPIKQNISIYSENIGFIPKEKKYIEATSQYTEPKEPVDIYELLSIIVNKKNNKNLLNLIRILYKWRKNALGDKITINLYKKQKELLKKIIIEICENYRDRMLRKKFWQFINNCKLVPRKIIEQTKNEEFNIIDIRPDNEKVNSVNFNILKKQKTMPSLKIDTKEKLSIFRRKKILVNENTQINPIVIDFGTNPEISKNEIANKATFNYIKNRPKKVDTGTQNQKIENSITEKLIINYKPIPKEKLDEGTKIEIPDNEICNKDELNIHKIQKELKDFAFQYRDPRKPTSKTNELTKILNVKITKNNYEIEKYFNKWKKIIKERDCNNKIEMIQRIFRQYIIRKKINTNQNKELALKKYIDITEKFLIKILKNNFKQFINNCHQLIPKKIEHQSTIEFTIIDKRPENIKQKITDIQYKGKIKKPLKMQSKEKLNIFSKKKKCEDSGCQIKVITFDKETQNEIIKNEITKNEQINFYNKKKTADAFTQNETYSPTIYKEKFNLICKVNKKDEGQQVGTQWKNVLSRIQNYVSFTPEKPKKRDNSSQYTIAKNTIKKTENVEFIKKQNKKLYKDTATYMEIPKNKINKDNKFTILKTDKNLINTECQYEIPKEYKTKEIQIRTVKRSLTKFELPILKKIWLRIAWRTFKENCKRPALHLRLEKELMRMYLLKWRFINGYGIDRYGIIYDRNGNIIKKTKNAKVADFGTQDNMKPDIKDDATQYNTYINKINKENNINIKASIINEPKIVLDKGVGDCKMNIDMFVKKIGQINYQGRIRPKNTISSRYNFNIDRIEKKLIDQGVGGFNILNDNKIQKINKIDLINESFRIKKISIMRIKELLLQIISKNIIKRKYNFKEYFDKWYNKMIQLKKIDEENILKNKNKPRISRIETFELINIIQKRDNSTDMGRATNKIEPVSRLQFANKKCYKETGCLVEFSPQFDNEKMKPSKRNEISYKMYKKPLILKTKRETDCVIYSDKYLYEEERKKGKILEKDYLRIYQILIKYIKNRENIPQNILEKYFFMWYRITKYLNMLENAVIIGDFCRNNFNNNRIEKKWVYLSEKLIMKEKILIMKIVSIVNDRKKKIINLIKLTRLLILYNKRRFSHYIIMYWYVYTINRIKKRNKIKALYENMMNTYVNMADDVFGNNKIENPSIQDAMYEAVESNKFQMRQYDDVPLARNYYSKKMGTKKIVTNIMYVKKEKEYEEKKEYTTYLKTEKPVISEVGNRKKIIYGRNQKKIEDEKENESSFTKSNKEMRRKMYEISKDK